MTQSWNLNRTTKNTLATTLIFRTTKNRVSSNKHDHFLYYTLLTECPNGLKFYPCFSNEIKNLILFDGFASIVFNGTLGDLGKSFRTKFIEYKGKKKELSAKLLLFGNRSRLIFLFSPMWFLDSKFSPSASPKNPALMLKYWIQN